MYSRILVGTDGSATAAKAVDRAVEVAKVTGGALTILSVGLAERAEEIVRREVERVATGADGVTITAATATGDPAAALIETAERDGYDLLVVGNKGMAGASRFLLGSVPNKVSHHAPCALLIAHTS